MDWLISLLNPFLTIPQWQPYWWDFLALLAITMTVIHLLGQWLKNATIVDVFWGFSFPLFLWLDVWLNNDLLGWWPRVALLLAMLTLEQGRLGIHLTQRVSKEHPEEDARYSKLRKQWENNYGSKAAGEWAMWGGFMVQGLMIALFMPPLWWITRQITPEFTLFEFIAIGIWAVGFLTEMTSDKQLAEFKEEQKQQNNDEKPICDVGLWGISRHPNYLGRWLIWVGYGLFALAVTYESGQLGFIWLYTTLLMGFIVTQLTGIQLTERYMLKSRGQRFAEYQERVAPFIPGVWWPKIQTDND